MYELMEQPGLRVFDASLLSQLFLSLIERHSTSIRIALEQRQNGREIS